MTDPAKILRDEARKVAKPATSRARERFGARAADAGLLDVAYAFTDSPFGPLVLAATPRGLVRVSFGHESVDDVVDQLATRISPRVLEAPARLEEARRELDEYFDGERKRFELPLDWCLVRGDFGRRVLRETYRLDYGETMSYAEAAARAGSARAFRAAGNALGSNPIPIVVPCHRVLASGGGLGGYGGGLEMKRGLLRLEGAL